MNKWHYNVSVWHYNLHFNIRIQYTYILGVLFLSYTGEIGLFYTETNRRVMGKFQPWINFWFIRSRAIGLTLNYAFIIQKLYETSGKASLQKRDHNRDCCSLQYNIMLRYRFDIIYAVEINTIRSYRCS